MLSCFAWLLYRSAGRSLVRDFDRAGRASRQIFQVISVISLVVRSGALVGAQPKSGTRSLPVDGAVVGRRRHRPGGPDEGRTPDQPDARRLGRPWRAAVGAADSGVASAICWLMRSSAAFRLLPPPAGVGRPPVLRTGASSRSQAAGFGRARPRGPALSSRRTVSGFCRRGGTAHSRVRRRGPLFARVLRVRRGGGDTRERKCAIRKPLLIGGGRLVSADATADWRSRPAPRKRGRCSARNRRRQSRCAPPDPVA